MSTPRQGLTLTATNSGAGEFLVSGSDPTWCAAILGSFTHHVQSGHATLSPRVGRKAHSSPLLTTCHLLSPGWDTTAHVSCLWTDRARPLQGGQSPQENASSHGQSLSTAGQPVPTLSLKRAAALLLYLSCRDQQGS